MTKSQIIQFVTMISQALYLFMFGCPYPTNLVFLYFFYILTMLALFLNFAKKTYSSKKGKDKSRLD